VDNGYAFAGWSGAGCSGAGTCTVTVTAAGAVTATFVPQTIVVSTTAVEILETGNTTVTVQLGYQPPAAVAVTIISTDNTIASVSSGSFTFTTSDWNVPRALTIASPDDANSTNANALVNLFAPSITTTTIAVTQQDDDLLQQDSPAMNQCPNGLLGDANTIWLADTHLAGPLSVTITRTAGSANFAVNPSMFDLTGAGPANGVPVAPTVGVTFGSATFTVSAPGQTSITFTLTAHPNTYCIGKMAMRTRGLLTILGWPSTGALARGRARTGRGAP
jgi:hypothetical protein